MFDLVTLISFWKRKETPPAPDSERIIPLPFIPGVSAESARTTSQEAVSQAGAALKVLKLEMQILGTALATIYESHSKGLINQAERDRLLEKYKVDLASLEKAIKENQRIVDLFDLESERERLVKNFKLRLAEIDAQLKTLNSGGSLNRPQKTGHDEEKKSGTETNEAKKTQSGQEQSVKNSEKKSSESDQLQITDAEKRIEQIRAEILQAMDRLEQIESEG